MRGYQKKVIYLKDIGSHLFDEAYLVVSRKGEEAKIEQSDMVFEANRIIKESLKDRESRIGGKGRRLNKSFIFPFFLGAFISLLLTFIGFFIVKLFVGQILI